jgi:hypothetical protein
MWSTILLVFFLYWVTRVVSRNGWPNRAGPDRLEPQHTAEIARLREEVDALTAQLVRLQDEQSFMMRLVEGGNAPAGTLPPPPAPEPTTNPEKS